MKHTGARFVVGVAVAVTIGGCAQDPTPSAVEEPASVEEIPGSELRRVTLSPRAAERLGIEMATVTQQGGRLTIPSTALLYDTEGRAWAYTSPSENVFVRHPVVVDEVDDGVAFVFLGPPEGTPVVTAGAAQLFGTETDVGGS